jgi:hypothetical protein
MSTRLTTRAADLRRLALIVVAAAAALLPAPPSLVERVYSNGLYSAAQPWITRASNRAPWALFDPLVAGVLGAWMVTGVRDLVCRRTWLPALGSIATRTLVWSSALYLGFLLAWGLNYRRLPLVDKLQFDGVRVSQDRARDLALTAADQLNELYAPAHGAMPPDGETSLAAAFVQAQRDLGAARLAAPGRPKSTVLNPYFRRAGVEGMTDPFFLETLIAGDLLPFERPFVIAHEWSHLAGIANEGEANFAGWLICLRGAPSERYSGWLFLFAELSRATSGSDRAAVLARLAPGPRDDLRAIARRMQQQVSPRVSAAGWRLYDRFLKANRVERGAASYTDVVKLALGVRFDAAWVPLKRATR